MFSKPKPVWVSSSNSLDQLPNNQHKHQKETAPSSGIYCLDNTTTAAAALNAAAAAAAAFRTVQPSANISLNSARCDHSSEHIQQDEEGVEWSICDLFSSRAMLSCTWHHNFNEVG